MSRAYRIQVQETLRRVVKGSDHIGTSLELLELLPKEQMEQLLAEELKGKGFEEQGALLVRRDGDVTITIDPKTGKVKVSAQVSEEVELKRTGTGYGDEDWGQIAKSEAEKRLRDSTRAELEEEVGHEEQRLTEKATKKLEDELRDLQGELDGIVNRVTAEALKRKAAQLGEIKSLTEDADSGSMTIVLEV